MSDFDGFPAGASYTAIPSLFFARLLPEIDDLAELKVILHVFYLLQKKRGDPRYVTHHELLADRTLISGLEPLSPVSEGDSPRREATRRGEGDVTDTLARGLSLATERGVLLGFTCGEGALGEPVYMINAPKNQEALARLRSGELTLPLGHVRAEQAEPAPGKRANIFVLYEENIGVLNPLIAEQLKEAEGEYPAEWVRAAFREAVTRNRRSWHYVSRILERWAREGRQDGEPERHSQIGEDPAKYIRGRYGRFVRH